MNLFIPTFVTTKVTIILMILVVVIATNPPNKLIRRGCPSKCGSVVIPYPFGIGDGCFYDLFYNITCNNTLNPPRPFYYNMEVFDIGLEDGKIRITNFVADVCYDTKGTQTWKNYPRLDMKRFTISSSDNVFAATGCDTIAWFWGTRHGRPYSLGCMTMCYTQEDVVNGTCSGVGCCQSAIPDGITQVQIDARSYYNHTKVSSFNPCSSAFVVAKDALNFSLANLTTPAPRGLAPKLPVIFDWTMGASNCSAAKANGTYICKENSTCYDTEAPGSGYLCKCLPGYSGNPYLEACQDVDECADQTTYSNCEKPEYCVNVLGNYTCRCPKGFHGSGTKADHCVPHKDILIFVIVTDIDECADEKLNDCEKPAICNNTQGSYICQCPKGYHASANHHNRCERDKKTSVAVFVVVGISAGIITSIVTAFLLFWYRQKKKLLKERENFFRQNGGHLLHQRLSNGQDVTAAMVKIFSIEELDKATNKYSNIIGKGGYGMVYKGVLANNQVVAIKTSLKVDPKQSEQFVNEVILLSKLNHRNVVKLIGCCLHTEVPRLVYEFINNGTLYHHLHDDARASRLTWSIRLKIASEVANVLSYLHTAISMPIIHRDMKSSNILLDTIYTAKVSDFGDSRLVPTDQDYLATALLGTRGYLDPEYIQTNELTPKSDVYSFGVVLAELLTGKEALSYNRPEKDVCLAFLFIRKWNEGRLVEILDDRILKDDGTIEQMSEVANIAQKCLRLKGEDRTTMEEVAMELHTIRKLTRSPSWLKTSAMVFQEEATLMDGGTSIQLDMEMSYTNVNTTDSSNSQVIGLLAAPLQSGR